MRDRKYQEEQERLAAELAARVATSPTVAGNVRKSAGFMPAG